MKRVGSEGRRRECLCQNTPQTGLSGTKVNVSPQGPAVASLPPFPSVLYHDVVVYGTVMRTTNKILNFHKHFPCRVTNKGIACCWSSKIGPDVV